MKKKVLGLGLIALMIALALPVAAFGATFNVSNTMTTAQINTTIANATAGDTIKFAAGEYDLAVALSITKSVILEGAKAGQSAKNGLRSKGDSSDTVLRVPLAAGGALNASNWGLILGASANDVTIDGFVFDGVNQSNRPAIYQNQATSGVTIKNNVFLNSYYAVYGLRSSGACLIEDNWFDGFRTSALYASQASTDYSIINNRFTNGPSGDCLQVSSTVEKLRMKFNYNVIENVYGVAFFFANKDLEMIGNKATVNDNGRMFGIGDAVSFSGCNITGNDISGGSVGIFVANYGTGMQEFAVGNITGNSLLTNPEGLVGDIRMNAGAAYTGSLVIGENYWGGEAPVTTYAAASKPGINSEVVKFYLDEDMTQLGTMIFNKTTSTYYDTLALAVAAANDGDTIALGKAIIPLASALTINKKITLKGAGRDLTTLKLLSNILAPDPTTEATGGAALNISAEATLKDFTLDGGGESVLAYSGINAQAPVVISNVAVKNIYRANNTGNGIMIWRGGTLSNITCTGIERVGLYIANLKAFDQATTTVDGYKYTGKGNPVRLSYGINIVNGGIAVVNNADIKQADGNVGVWGSTAVQLSSYNRNDASDTRKASLVLTNSDLTGNKYGIYVGYGGAEKGSLECSISGTVMNMPVVWGTGGAGATSVDFSGNYWGGDAPSLDDDMYIAPGLSSSLTLVNYYSNPAMTPASLTKLLSPARINMVYIGDTQISIDFDDPNYVIGTTYMVLHRLLGTTDWTEDGPATKGILDVVTGLDNTKTYEFKVVSSAVGGTADSRIVAASPQAPAAATTQPVPVVTQTQVDAGEVAPLTFVVPNSIIAGTTPSSDAVGPITVTIPAENQVKVNSLTITAMTTIPAGVIAPNTTVAPTRFIEIKPTGAAGVPVTTTDEYTKVVVGYAETVSSDLKNFALYYNHDRITYAVPKVANAAAGTGNFFWFDNGVARTYTFNTKVYSTLMGVVSTNAETEAEGNIDAPVIPTPASSAWTILALTLVALGVAAVVGRKV